VSTGPWIERSQEAGVEVLWLIGAWLPLIPIDQLRRLRGKQEIIARYEPEQAVLTLPALLEDPGDRTRLLTLLDKLIADPRVQEG
jgi:hypothetical protein